MNFADIYNKIKAIDEGKHSDDTEGTPHSHQAKNTLKHLKNPSYGDRADAANIEPGIKGVESRIKFLQRAEKEGNLKDESIGDVEECGDMMPMGGSISSPGQSDSVTMSVSMNGSGDGGIRDLMNILKGIENAGEPHADHDEMDVVFGGEMEPEMEAFANSMAGASGQAYLPQSAVTDIGSNDGRGDHEVRKANGGGNPYTQVSEELVSQLSSLYQEIKEAGDKKTMSRAAKGYEKYGKEGMQALAKAGKEGKDLDKVRDKYNKYD
jgi:hypothetical protein